MPKVTIIVDVDKTDGPKVEAEELVQGLVDFLEDQLIEAGDEPSVYAVNSVTQA
jgi:hypothetical protein